MAAHSSILAWRFLRTEEPEPGGLQSMWSQRVRQDLTINTLSWKGQRFILAETDTYSVYRFAFPAQNASAKTTIHRLRECLIYFLLLFYKALLLIKELISQQKKKKKKVWQWPREFTGLSYYNLCHTKTAGLIEQWHDLLKTQAEHQPGGNTLHAWAKTPQKFHVL